LLEMIAFTIAINTKMFRSKSHQGSKSYPRWKWNKTLLK
jgi:hypothetical protein